VLALGDSEFTRTYFGVTPVEAALNGEVTPLSASGGITSVGATAAVGYDWTHQWSTMASSLQAPSGRRGRQPDRRALRL
jgi:outer membrane scaffolding protein for murein synthesis (MipA/OmpV family)